ncbi:LIC12192 family sporadic carbohydrate cluster protein [Synechococcus sp. KORDI-100]|uniref:LIC12192 family sporadic carbohydrate cluster protein n=1 Tax=Synechococcus sp. KORDI-100 TaxID=1280380 RepID=UPI0008FFB5A7|nr:LIC12192 family sporadic carbohydrate cluster protein [Synechococcus sp. KORDI-100]
MKFARGYIASGEFRGNRAPQHIQNRIIKSYCDSLGLSFVLSRAEYALSAESQCQLWAALYEGFPHVVFFSVWQLPLSASIRSNVYSFCMTNNINLHFAVEGLILNDTTTAQEIENLILIDESLANMNHQEHLTYLKNHLS